MTNYYVSDLTPGMVVWQSGQQANVRLTVYELPVEEREGYWTCLCTLDDGSKTQIGETPSYRALGLYSEPAYSGVRFVCARENIPKESLEWLNPEYDGYLLTAKSEATE